MYFGFNLSLGGVGSYVGSKILANILYNMDGFKYSIAEEDVLGEELVTNGDFSDGTDGWTGTGAILSVDTQRLKVTVDGASSGRAVQSITTEVGKKYTISVDKTDGTNTYWGILADGVAWIEGPSSTSADGKHTYEYIAIDTSTELRFYAYTDGAYMFFDNISVKEVLIPQNDIYVKNKGSNTNNDLLLYSGEPLEVAVGNEFDVPIDANTKSLLTHTIENGWTHVTALSGTTYTVPQNTYSQLFTVNSLVTEADLALMNSDIDIVAREALDGNTALSFSQGDIKGYYQPMRYQGGYLQNMMVDLGSENADITNQYGSVSGNNTTSTTNGITNINNIELNNQSYLPYVRFIGAFEEGKLYNITLTIESVSGVVEGRSLNFGDGTSNIYYTEFIGDIVPSGESKTWTFIGGFSVADKIEVTIGDDTNTVFEANVSISMKEIEAIPIPNYSQATNYDNNDFNPKGHQTTHYTYDASGRVTAINDDRLNFYGNSYGDTGWIPSGSFTVEQVVSLDDSVDGYDSASMNGSSYSFAIGKHTSGKRHYVVCGGTYINGSALLSGVNYYHQALVIDAEKKEASFYINSVLQETKTYSSDIAELRSFYIGVRNGAAGVLLEPIALFNVHNKTMTAEEVAEAYAKAKQTVTTLP